MTDKVAGPSLTPPTKRVGDGRAIGGFLFAGGAKGKWVSTGKNTDGTAAALPKLPPRIKILSFNIMKEKVDSRIRMQALVKLIEVHHPDFICLQEMVSVHIKWIKSATFIRKNYSISSKKGQSGFQVRLLAKISYGNRLYHYTLRGKSNGFPGGERDAVTMYVQFEAGHRLAVTSIHLDPTNEMYREKQLRQVYEHTQHQDTSLVAGDFNMKYDETPVVTQIGFIDMWANLHPEWVAEGSGATRPMPLLPRHYVYECYVVINCVHVFSSTPLVCLRMIS